MEQIIIINLPDAYKRIHTLKIFKGEIAGKILKAQ